MKIRETSMSVEFVPVVNQRFDIGRTVNPFLCNCKTCDFKHCPKDNYVLKMKPVSHTKEETFEHFKSRFLELNNPEWQHSHSLIIDYDLLNDIMEYMNYKFPTNTFWSSKLDFNDNTEFGKTEVTEIVIQKINRSGNIVNLGEIQIKNGNVYESDFSEQQWKLANRLGASFKYFKEKVLEYYEELAK